MPTNEVRAKVSAFVRNNPEVVNAPDGTGKKGAVPGTEIPGKSWNRSVLVERRGSRRARSSDRYSTAPR